jgi:hypothetical protein
MERLLDSDLVGGHRIGGGRVDRASSLDFRLQSGNLDRESRQGRFAAAEFRAHLGRVEPDQRRPGPNLPPEETRNRVAVLVPLSGANAGVGTSIANAANLALLDSGGDRIRITVYDTAKSGAAVGERIVPTGGVRPT